MEMTPEKLSKRIEELQKEIGSLEDEFSKRPLPPARLISETLEQLERVSEEILGLPKEPHFREHREKYHALTEEVVTTVWDSWSNQTPEVKQQIEKTMDRLGFDL